MRRELPIPDDLRQAIRDAIADFERQRVELEQARTAAAAQIANLETLVSDLTARLPALNAKIVAEGEASLELVATERRISAVNKQLEELRGESAAVSGPNSDQIRRVLGQVVSFYVEAVPAAVLSDLAPYGCEPQMAGPLIASLHALQILTIIRDKVLGLGILQGDSNRVLAFLRRAERGQVNLNVDVEESEIPNSAGEPLRVGQA